MRPALRTVALGCAAVTTVVLLAGCNLGRASSAGPTSSPNATSADPLAGYESTVVGIERDVDGDAGTGR